MMLCYKFTIFFVLTIVHLVKTQHGKELFRSQFKNDSKVQSPSEPLIYNGPTIKPIKYIMQNIPHMYNTTTTTTTNQPEFITTPPYVVPKDVSFRLSDVGLRKIGPNLISSNDYISLSLDNNEINYISPYAFHKMPNLQYLDLSGNKIPTENLLLLAKNDRLQTLIINNNNGSTTVKPTAKVLKEYETFYNLKHLHLCHNRLQDLQVPLNLATPVLSHLHLSNNSISSSSTILDNIPATLTHLHLDRNLINRIEGDKLRYVHELIIDKNVITQICFEDCQDKSISLKGAHRMSHLSLSRNLISEVSPDAFKDTKRLTNLNLSGNKIDNIAKGTFNHTREIFNLSLADNYFTTVPDICPIVYLKSLNLTGNRIGAILSSTFCASLAHLEYLYLSNNKISTIQSPAFVNLEALKYLDLSGNELRQLPQLWLMPWFITELHLERNYITELDHVSLNRIESLKNVYLDENPMHTLEAKSLQSLPANLKIHLKNVRIENKCAQCPQDNDSEEGENNSEENNYY